MMHRLKPSRFDATDETATPTVAGSGLTSAVLLHNARWFTHIRWGVIVLMTLVGIAGLLADEAILHKTGFLEPGTWPLLLAGILTLLNLISIRWCQRLEGGGTGSWNTIAANIWFQIITDLVVLSGVVLQVGPTCTVVAFAYLFHITLACIFFGRRDSFLVTLLSIALFAVTVILPLLQHCPPSRLLRSQALHVPELTASLLFALPTVAVWLVVWHLVSTLSETVRRQDRDLDAANRRILDADAEMNRQMLRITHDLKAPFAGIESNIQILKTLHWDNTPGDVRRIINKIDARSSALRNRISDILMLGSLRSTPDRKDRTGPIRLRDLIHAVCVDIQGLTSTRQIAVRISESETEVTSCAGPLKILFSNLLSNAVSYSREGGQVEIEISEMSDGGCVRIIDHGIGIRSEAMPRVFEDFYRSPAAAAFNPDSTGLGLAIVRQVARNLQLTVAVESEENIGTTFEVQIPNLVG